MLEVSKFCSTRIGTARVCQAHGRKHHGFTLIELLIVIAIAAIAMSVGVPSFVQFIRNANLSDALSNFMTAANSARAHAMKTGVNAFLVPKITANGWQSGWMVFSDKNWNATYDAGTDELVTQHETISTEITITTTGATGGPNTLVDGYLLFNGSGFPRLKAGGFANGTIQFSTVDRSSRVIFYQTGRIRTCKTTDLTCV